MIKVRVIVDIVHPKTKDHHLRWKEVDLLQIPRVGWRITIGGHPGKLFSMPSVETVILHEGGGVTVEATPWAFKTVARFTQVMIDLNTIGFLGEKISEAS